MGSCSLASPGIKHEGEKMVYPRKGIPWASKSVHIQTNPSSIYLSYAFYGIVSYSSVLPLSMLSPLFFLPLCCAVPLTLPYLSQLPSRHQSLSSASHDTSLENQKLCPPTRENTHSNSMEETADKVCRCGFLKQAHRM